MAQSEKIAIGYGDNGFINIDKSMYDSMTAQEKKALQAQIKKEGGRTIKDGIPQPMNIESNMGNANEQEVDFSSLFNDSSEDDTIDFSSLFYSQSEPNASQPDKLENIPRGLATGATELVGGFVGDTLLNAGDLVKAGIGVTQRELRGAIAPNATSEDFAVEEWTQPLTPEQRELLPLTTSGAQKTAINMGAPSNYFQPTDESPEARYSFHASRTLPTAALGRYDTLKNTVLSILAGATSGIGGEAAAKNTFVGGTKENPIENPYVRAAGEFAGGFAPSVANLPKFSKSIVTAGRDIISGTPEEQAAVIIQNAVGDNYIPQVRENIKANAPLYGEDAPTSILAQDEGVSGLDQSSVYASRELEAAHQDFARKQSEPITKMGGAEAVKGSGILQEGERLVEETKRLLNPHYQRLGNQDITIGQNDLGFLSNPEVKNALSEIEVDLNRSNTSGNKISVWEKEPVIQNGAVIQDGVMKANVLQDLRLRISNKASQKVDGNSLPDKTKQSYLDAADMVKLFRDTKVPEYLTLDSTMKQRMDIANKKIAAGQIDKTLFNKTEQLGNNTISSDLNVDKLLEIAGNRKIDDKALVKLFLKDKKQAKYYDSVLYKKGGGRSIFDASETETIVKSAQALAAQKAARGASTKGIDVLLEGSDVPHQAARVGAQGAAGVSGRVVMDSTIRALNSPAREKEIRGLISKGLIDAKEFERLMSLPKKEYMERMFNVLNKSKSLRIGGASAITPTGENKEETK